MSNIIYKCGGCVHSNPETLSRMYTHIRLSLILLVRKCGGCVHSNPETLSQMYTQQPLNDARIATFSVDLADAIHRKK